MEPFARDWTEIPEDNPIPLLHRRKFETEHMLAAKVFLAKGCHVEIHHHASEQLSMIQSGKVRWRIGVEGTMGYIDRVVGGGEVVFLPSNVPHGVDALEDTHILDVLSPPAAMGVDKQGK